MTTGTFTRTPEGVVLISASDPRFVARALHPMARVGSTPVVGVVCVGGTLTGRVLGNPSPGAELVVRYPPEPEIRTGVQYALEPPRVS
ncbi:MAG: hypothetical protein ABMA64_00840 [Myxococcota bacterium]